MFDGSGILNPAVNVNIELTGWKVIYLVRNVWESLKAFMNISPTVRLQLTIQFHTRSVVESVNCQKFITIRFNSELQNTEWFCRIKVSVQWCRQHKTSEDETLINVSVHFRNNWSIDHQKWYLLSEVISVIRVLVCVHLPPVCVSDVTCVMCSVPCRSWVQLTGQTTSWIITAPDWLACPSPTRPTGSLTCLCEHTWTRPQEAVSSEQTRD